MELNEMIAEWVASNDGVMEKVHEYYEEEIWYNKDNKSFYKLLDEADGTVITEINPNSNKYEWYVKRYLFVPRLRVFLNKVLSRSIRADFAEQIVNNIIDDIIEFEDVKPRDDGSFDEDEVKLAIGMSIAERLASVNY